MLSCIKTLIVIKTSKQNSCHIRLHVIHVFKTKPNKKKKKKKKKKTLDYFYDVCIFTLYTNKKKKKKNHRKTNRLTTRARLPPLPSTHIPLISALKKRHFFSRSAKSQKDRDNVTRGIRRASPEKDSPIKGKSINAYCIGTKKKATR